MVEGASPVELARLARLHAALRRMHQALLRTSDRDRLFQQICDVLVEVAGFTMVWIGWNDDSRRVLVPVAYAGDAGTDMREVRVSTDEANVNPPIGPSGTAFVRGRPYVCNDVLLDPLTLPWRANLERNGVRAVASFPLQRDRKPCAILCVSSREPGFFRDEEVALLSDAADDLSFAIELGERRRVQEEARLASDILEATPGVFYLYDETGRFLRWNQAFEKISGYSGAEIATMHPLDFFGPDEHALLEGAIGEVFAKGEATVEASFLAKSGVATPYFFTGRRIQFRGMTCLVGIGVDIAERKRAELALVKTEQRYRSTLDNIIEGCQLLDFDWKYLYINASAEVQNRRPNSELLGRRMPDAWPGIESTHAFSILKRAMEERVALHDETEFVFPDGGRGWFDVHAQPVPEGIFVLSIDVSQRRNAEVALRELNEQLERKVEERTRELVEARARAESADKLKSAFLATMSHELRTPLNAIIGFTSIMLQGLAGPTNAEQQKQLGMVHGSGQHLLELINDVLDVSKIEAGQLEIKPQLFDARPLLDRVVDSIRPLAMKKSLSLGVSAPTGVIRMVSDRRRVEQILLNLLNNAVKFTDRGRVLLEVAVSEGEAGKLSIRVVDTGIGIKAEDLDKLYEPFRQIDAGLERQHEGTGLGLAICRRLAGLLGGSISVESVWGEGSVFSVTLPLNLEGAG